MSDLQLAIIAVLVLRIVLYMTWGLAWTKLDVICIFLVAARLALTVYS